MMRCLRPERMIYALQGFIEEKLGKRYVQNSSLPFEESFKESGSATPMFFILSPGVDPLKDVEGLGKNWVIHLMKRIFIIFYLVKVKKWLLKKQWRLLLLTGIGSFF